MRPGTLKMRALGFSETTVQAVSEVFTAPPYVRTSAAASGSASARNVIAAGSVTSPDTLKSA